MLTLVLLTPTRLVFRLPPGPLVGEDCNICWTEFEVRSHRYLPERVS